MCIIYACNCGYACGPGSGPLTHNRPCPKCDGKMIREWDEEGDHDPEPRYDPDDDDEYDEDEDDKLEDDDRR